MAAMYIIYMYIFHIKVNTQYIGIHIYSLMLYDFFLYVDVVIGGIVRTSMMGLVVKGSLVCACCGMDPAL